MDTRGPRLAVVPADQNARNHGQKPYCGRAEWNASPAGKNQTGRQQKSGLPRQVGGKEQEQGQSGVTKEQAEQDCRQNGGMQQVGQIVIVENIDPEGHQENSRKDRDGSPPGPQQPGHQGDQRHHADDAQQQEAGVDAEASDAAQPAGHGRAQNTSGERCRDGAPLAEREQAILARIGRVYGAWQAKQDGKAQAPGRKKQGAGHECRLDHFSCRGNKRADAQQPKLTGNGSREGSGGGDEELPQNGHILLRQPHRAERPVDRNVDSFAFGKQGGPLVLWTKQAIAELEDGAADS